MSNQNPNTEWYDDTEAGQQAAGNPGAAYRPHGHTRQRRRKLLGVGLIVLGLLLFPRAIFGSDHHDDWDHERIRMVHGGPRDFGPNFDERDFGPNLDDEIEGQIERAFDDQRESLERQMQDLEREKERIDDENEERLEDIERQMERLQEDLEDLGR